MARFLFVSYAAPGHLTPVLVVADALRRRRHQVAVLTSGGAAAAVAARDVELIASRRWMATLDWIASQKAPPSPLQKFLQFRRSMRTVLFDDANHMVHDVREALSTWPADAIISSDITAGVSLAMGEARLPWATLTPRITCPLASEEAPPWCISLPVPRTAKDRRRLAITRRMRALLFRSLLRDWSTVRARYRLPAVTTDLAGAIGSPFLYMVPGSSDFDRPRSDLPSQVHYVGPCLSPPAANERWVNPFPPGRPLVYATAGTIHNAREFLGAFIEASRGEPYNLFVTVGKGNDPAAYGDLPPNVRLAPFVAQDLVLRQASAVLCNGGSGAVMAALVHGRPLVLIPLAADQPDNGLRCVERGLGVVVQSRPLEVQSIRRAVRQVLEDDAFRVRAERLGAALSHMDGPACAADLLERLAATGAPVLRDRPWSAIA